MLYNGKKVKKKMQNVACRNDWHWRDSIPRPSNPAAAAMTTGQRDVRTEASHPWTLTLLP
jgi:hypothetical protein